MREHAFKETAENARHASAAGTGDVERRAHPHRRELSAVAEVMEISSGIRLSARITDLGLGGCYVDTLTPLLMGSRVQLSVPNGETTYETIGTVVYSHPGLGMGIAFDRLTPEQYGALEAWLAELGAQPESPSGFPMPIQRIEERLGTERGLLIELVQLLIQKGILTKSEGTTLLDRTLS